MFSKTVNGIDMNPWDLDPRIVTVEHIASVLARINRYAGHWVYPISVARHCIILTDTLKERGHNSLIQLQGLLHDASEAYTQDIPSPLKAMLKIAGPPWYEDVSYSEFENALLGRIFTQLGVPLPIDPEVVRADKDAYDDEIPIIRGQKKPKFLCDPEVCAIVFERRARDLMHKLGIPYPG